MFDWAKYGGEHEWLANSTILLVPWGSHAQGLATETSDFDYRGVCIPPKEYFSGWRKRFEQADEFDVIDCAVYGIRKFFALASDGNPNVLEIVWTDRAEDITTFGWVLRGLKREFLSRKIKDTFSGYAFNQLRRIKSHKRWLLNPPARKPMRGEFELPEASLLSPDIMGAIEALNAGKLANTRRREEWYEQHGESFGPEVMHTYQRERAYRNALREWQQYESWKKRRNPARAELEEKFGYDTKHAMHLVRLMRMGAEILEHGEVNVWRHDREELLEIRAGAWSYDRIVAYAAEMDERLNELEGKSSLPATPNYALLDDACCGIVEGFHGWLR